MAIMETIAVDTRGNTELSVCDRSSALTLAHVQHVTQNQPLRNLCLVWMVHPRIPSEPGSWNGLCDLKSRTYLGIYLLLLAQPRSRSARRDRVERRATAFGPHTGSLTGALERNLRSLSWNSGYRGLLCARMEVVHVSCSRTERDRFKCKMRSVPEQEQSTLGSGWLLGLASRHSKQFPATVRKTFPPSHPQSRRSPSQLVPQCAHLHRLDSGPKRG